MDTLRVALVDDEEELLFALRIILEAQGWEVETYSDAEEALKAFGRALPQVIVTDIKMPGKDGIWLCRELRKLSEIVPILFLSAKMEEMDRVTGLESGADDYLVKPFSTQELIARIKIQKRKLDQLNRSESEKGAPLRRDGFALDGNAMTLSAGEGEGLPLTYSEFRILELLFLREGGICSREEILRRVYREDTYVCDRVIDNHIKRIREKLRRLPSDASRNIETVYGIGYRWRSR